MLKVANLDAGYGSTQILSGISLDISRGEIVTLIGANGAGKTTLLMTISGIIKPTSGTIEFMGMRIDGLPAHTICSLGIVQVPQGRMLFPEMSVAENLKLGAYLCKDAATKTARLQQVYSYFERLHERASQKAGTLSGGEQQMLAIGRSLMANPKLLMLDEPSSGLAPILVEELGRIICQLRDTGLTILLIEQNAYLALDIADKGYVVESGCIVLSGKASDLTQDPLVKRAYLGA